MLLLLEFYISEGRRLPTTVQVYRSQGSCKGHYKEKLATPYTQTVTADLKCEVYNTRLMNLLQFFGPGHEAVQAFGLANSVRSSVCAFTRLF